MAVGRLYWAEFDTLATVGRLYWAEFETVSGGVSVGLPVASASVDPGGSLGVQHVIPTAAAQTSALAMTAVLGTGIEVDLPVVAVNVQAQQVSPQPRVEVPLPVASVDVLPLPMSITIQGHLTVGMPLASVGVLSQVMNPASSGAEVGGDLAHNPLGQDVLSYNPLGYQ